MMGLDLTIEEIEFILEKIKDKPVGYADDPATRRLQSKLSVLLSVKHATAERRVAIERAKARR